MSTRSLKNIKMEWLAILAVVLLVFAGLSGFMITYIEPAIADTEANNSFAIANEIIPDIYNGMLDYTIVDTMDYFKIQLDSGSIVTITFSTANTTGTQYLKFYNPSQTELFSLSSSNSAIDTNKYYLANETTKSYWFIKIDGDYGSYTFTVLVDDQNDAGSLGDVAEDYDNAFNITEITKVSGHLDDLDLVDMYKIYIEGGYKILITFSSGIYSGLQLTLYDPDKVWVFEIYSDGTIIENYDNINQAESAGHWYIEIGNGIGNYSFNISVEILILIPPIITNVSVDASSYVVSIYWDTNEPTNGSVHYGLDSSYGFVEDDYYSMYTFTKEHNVYISGLTPGKTYHYKIVSYNSMGLKNETDDATFKIPRSTWVESQYNSLRTFILAESPTTSRGYSVGTQIKITVYCYDKGVAITPETISVSSATSINEISVTEQSTGVYTGKYTITQEDIDEYSLTLFADVSYKGNNDTAVFTISLEDAEKVEDWEVMIEYLNPEDQHAGFGDTINLKITVTKNDVIADPEVISASVIEGYSGYYDRGTTRISGIILETKKTATGEYTTSYKFPTEGNESKEYEFEVEIINNEMSEWNAFTHSINIFYVWYHTLSLNNKSTEFDVYITDTDNQIISGADVNITMSYYDLTWMEIQETQNKKTDSNGMTNFKFNYPDLNEESLELDGKVMASGKTQYFDTWISIPQDITTEPTPSGDDFEILALMVDDVFSSYYVSPDAQGNVKRDYKVYSISNLLINTEVYYYIISGLGSYYGPYETPYETNGATGMEVIKAGAATTDDQGTLSVQFKSSTTRATVDFYYYTIYVEAALGNFADFMPYSEVTSNDGMYYGEAYDYFIVTETPFSLKLKDLISGNIKITIPKLNKGTVTNIEITYTGSFTEPMVMANFFPGTISLDNLVMITEFDWGVWTGVEGAYLTKSNGKYTGQFTIPTFMPDGTYTIIVAVYNTDSMMSESSLMYYNWLVINLVTLKIGESVKDGGLEGEPLEPEEPSEEEVDSDRDGYSDATEKRAGTNPNDPTSYPGSEKDQEIEESTVNGADVLVVGTTTGNISLESVLEEEAPVIPEDVGEGFNFYIDITSDEAVSKIYIEVDLGLVGGDIIPAGTEPKTIKLFYFDEEKDEWIEVKDSSYDPKTGKLWAKLDHLTIFAPMSKASEEKEDEGFGNIAIIIVVIIVVVFIILSIIGLVRKKRKKGKEGVIAGEGSRVQPPAQTQTVTGDIGTGPQVGPESPPGTPPKETLTEDTITKQPESAIPDEPVTTPTPQEPAQEPQGPPQEPPQEPAQPPTEPTSPQEPSQTQTVPCPTCQKMIPIYANPCPHCGMNLNW